MVSERPDEIRRTLAERVARRVQGHGISRASVDAAVTSVLDALQTAPTSAALQRESVAPRASHVVAAFSARSVPDLTSRVRAALAKEGVTPQTLGSASSGNHNVVTVRVPESSRAAAERAAASVSASISFLPEDSGG